MKKTPQERFKQSLMEMQKMREGKLPKKTWEELKKGESNANK